MFLVLVQITETDGHYRNKFVQPPEAVHSFSFLATKVLVLSGSSSVTHILWIEPKPQGVVANYTTTMSYKVEGGASMPMDLETSVRLVLKIQELSIKLFNEADMI